MSELNLDRVSTHVETRYALVTRRADVLAWPVDELIMDKPGDYAFNAILQSTVYRGTPVAVVHTSRDGQWAFIRSVYFDGWIKEEALARTTRAGAGEYPGSRFLIVTAPSVRSASGVELMMGTAVRMVRSSPDGYVVAIPARGNGGELVLLDDIVHADGVSEGFLPYTRRNVLVQAFKLLDAPYSWGGSTSGFDCSTFLYDVFAVFGIRLPRNSSWQAEVGRPLARFEERDLAADRLDTLHRWEPGVTLLEAPRAHHDVRRRGDWTALCHTRGVGSEGSRREDHEDRQGRRHGSRPRARGEGRLAVGESDRCSRGGVGVLGPEDTHPGLRGLALRPPASRRGGTRLHHHHDAVRGRGRSLESPAVRATRLSSVPRGAGSKTCAGYVPQQCGAWLASSLS